MGSIREATAAYQKAIIERIRENEIKVLQEKNVKLKTVLKSRKKK